MNAFSASLLRAAKYAHIALVAGVLGSSAAIAEPPKVERFDMNTWERLQKELPRPSAVVFTATYCANCPAVLAQLSNELQRQGVKGDVVAVVIDAAEPQELAHSEHYAHASRLFLFDGNEAQLRYRVDPRWRGVTPYVALLSAKDKTTFAAGTPNPAQMKEWLLK